MLKLISILAVVIVIVKADFPNDPKPCKYGDVECIVNIINYFIKEKAVGGDSAINLVEIDPLHVKSININQGAESPVNIDLTFTDNNIVGMKSLKFRKAKGFGENPAKKHEILYNAPLVSLLGPYTIKGKILILPISGSGTSNMTLVNTDMVISFIGETYEKNGETYMKATNLKLHTRPERLIYQFTNLFNGDKALGDNMNTFLNENWKSIFDEVQDSFQNAFAKVFEAVITNVFSKQPYAKFFAQ